MPQYTMKPVKHTRTWHGTTYTLVQTPHGWVCSNGFTYSSLSAAAKDITKQSISGPLFWGVTSRKEAGEGPKTPKTPRAAKAREKAKGKAEPAPKPAQRVARKGGQAEPVAAKAPSLAELERQYEAARAELLARLEAEGRAIVERLGKIKAG